MSRSIVEDVDYDRLMYLYSSVEDNKSVVEVDILEFWSEKIREYCNNRGSVVLEYSPLTKAFTSRGLFPSSLQPSLYHMTKSLKKIGTLKALESLNNKVEKIQHDDNAKDEEISILTWAMSKLITTITTVVSSSEHSSITDIQQVTTMSLIYTPMLADLQQRMTAYMNNHGLEGKDTIFTLDPKHKNLDISFHSLLQKVLLTLQKSNSTEDKYLQQYLEKILSDSNQQEIQIFINHLIEKNVAIRYQHNDHILLKVSSTGSLTTKNKTRDEAEITLITMQINLQQLTTKCSEYELRVQELLKQAASAKREGNNSLALTHLHIKRNISTTLQRLYGARLQLENALHMVEDTQMNANIIRAYQDAAKSMRLTREQTGLTVDSVDDAMQSFEDELSNIKEISEAVESVVVTIIDDTEKEELEEELNELLNASEEQPVINSSNTSKILYEQLPEAPKTTHPVKQSNFDRTTILA